VTQVEVFHSMRGWGGGALPAVSGAHSRWIAVGEGGTILRSTDRGETWLPLPSGVEGTLLGIWMADGRNVVAVGEHGLILRSRP
jgi:photosystem II stability/assembly factor-like uncharacterized protein